MAVVQRAKGSPGATGSTYSSVEDSERKLKDIRLADAQTERQIAVGGKGKLCLQGEWTAVVEHVHSP